MAESPLVTLGSGDETVAIQAWLDLSSHEQRKSLRALIEFARHDASVGLAFFPAGGGDEGNGQTWRRTLWCAHAQQKARALL